MRIRGGAVIMFCLLAGTIHASDAKDIASAIRGKLYNKVFLLRGLPTDKKLEFDSNVQLVSQIHAGPWQAAEMQVTDVQARGHDVRIDGTCLGYVANSVKSGRKIEITLRGPFAGTPDETLDLIKKNVFLTDGDELKNTVPPQWVRLFSNNPLDANTVRAGGSAPDGAGGTVFRVGGAITAPRPIYSPDPEYSEAARKANYQGVVVLAVVIGPDGNVHEAHVVRPAGLGLDEQALAAVQLWRFKPATRDGVPVATLVNVEVSFNLYKGH